ncbi:DUF6636 domain-containing protein [Rhodococcus sp. UFZ-B548]|uniref:DUF6636 domain-containing protein n=1 Tax=Rhodococcus sp. UFZ-B548 TaxID=2742212 RepID=UPI0015F6D04D|nr:DUF6636 domain-containing protein [Rhodococcus sp. UFZ-B548]
MNSSSVRSVGWRRFSALLVLPAAAMIAAAGCSAASTEDFASAQVSSGAAAEESGAGSVTVEDLLSAPVPALCEHEAGTLVDGRLPLQNPMYGGVEIASTPSGSDDPFVAFGDITGDGVADGALVTFCTAGGVGWPATVQLYTEGPTLLGGIDLGDVTGGREIVENISIADGVVHVEWLTNGPDDGACCPTSQRSGEIRWDGSNVVIEKVQEIGVTAYRFEHNGSYYFTSPSGKFQCGILDADIAPRGQTTAGCHGETSPIPPRPTTCSTGAGWGHGMQVDQSGAVSFLCTGGLIFGTGTGDGDPVLDYGRELTAEGFRCTSEVTGVTCTHEGSGHGFTIASTTNSSF